MRLGIISPILLTISAATCAAAPPGFTMNRTGTVGDFQYFRGAWQTMQHKRSGELDSPKGKWEDFPGTLCMRPYLDGLATVDELYFPTHKTAGLTLRTFDRQKHQWSIYWVGSITGKLDPVPVVGGFVGNRGEFYARDTVGGRPAKVRYLWIIKDADHARWEQALSFDDEHWLTNWTADFTRADPAEICSEGRPIR